MLAKGKVSGNKTMTSECFHLCQRIISLRLVTANQSGFVFMSDTPIVTCHVFRLAEHSSFMDLPVFPPIPTPNPKMCGGGGYHRFPQRNLLAAI